MNLSSAAVPVDRQKCLPGHVCLLLQVATGEGQLAVPMERRCGPNKRRREKENQLNLRWPPETTREDPSRRGPDNETAARLNFKLGCPAESDSTEVGVKQSVWGEKREEEMLCDGGIRLK